MQVLSKFSHNVLTNHFRGQSIGVSRPLTAEESARHVSCPPFVLFRPPHIYTPPCYQFLVLEEIGYIITCVRKYPWCVEFKSVVAIRHTTCCQVQAIYPTIPSIDLEPPHILPKHSQIINIII